MANHTASNWKDLVAAVNGECRAILEDYVAPVGKQILKTRIRRDIYGAYRPVKGGYFAGVRYTRAYQRRHVLEENIMHIMDNPNTMTITSRAPANTPLLPGYRFQNRYPGAFLQMLENGNMGLWRKGFPRPAVSNTEAQFATDSKIQNAIKRGIKGRIES